MWLYELSLESKISKTLRTICLMNRNPILIFVTILRKNHPPDPSSIVHPRKRPFLWMETKMGAPEKAEIAFRRKIAYFLYEKDLCYSAGGGGGLRRSRARKGVVWCTRGGLVHLSSLDFVPVNADFTEVPDEIGGDGYLELLGIELNVIMGDGVVEV